MRRLARSAEGMQIVRFCVLQKPVIMIRACWTNEATLSFSEYSIARGSLTVQPPSTACGTVGVGLRRSRYCHDRETIGSETRDVDF
jgi:hypothetical protein